jgi:hypothetical protein
VSDESAGRGLALERLTVLLASQTDVCKYFLQVLLEETPDKAGLVFDEIAAQGTSKDGAVSADKFFTSSMSNYLTARCPPD